MTNKRDIIKRKNGEVIKEAKISNSKKSLRNQISSRKSAAIVIGISVLIILMIALVTLWLDQEIPTYIKEETFKEQFEKYNGKKNANDEEYPKVKIDKDNIVQYVDYDKIFSILDKGTGVFYFGNPESISDRRILPNLLESSDEVGLDVIYYKDISKDKEKNTKDYQKLLKYFDLLSVDCLEIEIDCIGIENNYIPTIVFVKEGNIIFTYDSNSFIEYADSVKKILLSKMNELITCNDAC